MSIKRPRLSCAEEPCEKRHFRSPQFAHDATAAARLFSGCFAPAHRLICEYMGRGQIYYLTRSTRATLAPPLPGYLTKRPEYLTQTPAKYWATLAAGVRNETIHAGQYCNCRLCTDEISTGTRRSSIFEALCCPEAAIHFMYRVVAVCPCFVARRIFLKALIRASLQFYEDRCKWTVASAVIEQLIKPKGRASFFSRYICSEDSICRRETFMRVSKCIIEKHLQSSDIEFFISVMTNKCHGLRIRHSDATGIVRVARRDMCRSLSRATTVACSMYDNAYNAKNHLYIMAFFLDISRASTENKHWAAPGRITCEIGISHAFRKYETARSTSQGLMNTYQRMVIREAREEVSRFRLTHV